MAKARSKGTALELKTTRSSWVTDPVTSRRMALVRRQDTRAELLLRTALFSLGLRYRLHARHLPGSPDIVFSRCKTAVFVHGCFWHQHQGCKRATAPRRNEAEWRAKLDSNVCRDARVQAQLHEVGWRSVIAWECDVLRNPAAVAKSIAEQLLANRDERS